MSPIVSFYSGVAPDAEGRWIHEIWDWEDDLLESVHDYIQWLFPLRTRSGFNPNAPVLSDADIQKFRGSDELRLSLMRSLQVMLRFYGFQLHQATEAKVIVDKSPTFASRSQVWLTPGNHNHLRLTRIVASTSLLGLHLEAVALQACLVTIAHEYPNLISERTLRFWKNATVT
ncbi:MAG: hypothetical protein NVSMB52_04090 [Chloroflexota bacterium]